MIQKDGRFGFKMITRCVILWCKITAFRSKHKLRPWSQKVALRIMTACRHYSLEVDRGAQWVCDRGLCDPVVVEVLAKVDAANEQQVPAVKVKVPLPSWMMGALTTPKSHEKGDAPTTPLHQIRAARTPSLADVTPPPAGPQSGTMVTASTSPGVDLDSSDVYVDCACALPYYETAAGPVYGDWHDKASDEGMALAMRAPIQ